VWTKQIRFFSSWWRIFKALRRLADQPSAGMHRLADPAPERRAPETVDPDAEDHPVPTQALSGLHAFRSAVK
jgi:hypothetical protein